MSTANKQPEGYVYLHETEVESLRNTLNPSDPIHGSILVALTDLEKDLGSAESAVYRDVAGAKNSEVEVDANARVSGSDEGAYVACWTWVSREEAEEQDPEAFKVDGEHQK